MARKGTTIEEILNIADQVIPEWRAISRKEEPVFARAILAIELRKIGTSYPAIAKIFNQTHSTIQSHLKKKGDPAFMSEKQIYTYNKWQLAIRPKQTIATKINNLCQEIRDLLKLTCTQNITISEKGYSIKNEGDKKKTSNRNT